MTDQRVFESNVIKLSIRALILEETLLKKGFFQAIFPKLLKVFGNRELLWRGFKGKTLFQKGFPLKLMTLVFERGAAQTAGPLKEVLQR
jgi:hypothetical protein